MPFRRPRWSFLTWLIAGLVVVTLTMGIIGYANLDGEAFKKDMQSSPGGFGRLLDVVYDAISLMLLGAKNTYGSWWLTIGRWFGLAFSFFAVLKLVSARLEKAHRRFLIGRLRGHTVVVGLGAKGTSFARSAVTQAAVVTVDVKDGDPDPLALADGPNRVFTLKANVAAQDDEVLRLIGSPDADRIVLTTGDDALNVAIARRLVRRLAAQPRSHDHGIEILVHVADAALRTAELSDVPVGDGITVRPFSEPALAVRRLFSHWAPAVLARLLGAPAMHLVLVGHDAHTEEVALQATRMCPLPGQGPTRLTFFVRNPALAAQELLRRFPALAELSVVDFRSFDPHAGFAVEELHAVEALHRENQVTAIFVSAGSDADALMIARRLRVRTIQHRCWLAPIFVRLRRPEEAAEALQPIGTTKWLSRAIEPFGDIASSCSRTGLDDLSERRARRVHEEYLAEAGRAGTPRSAGSLLRWEKLAEELRESNRRAVDHFALKLAAMGYLLPEGAPRLDAPMELLDHELETLARFEHESWSAEKLLAGWRPGERRDQVRRIHEWLRPFEELGEARRRDLTQIVMLNNILSSERVAGSAVRERRIGLVGHNVLTAAGARRVGQAMPDVLKALEHARQSAGRGPEVWSFVTPLGPGADVTLAEAVVAVLGSAGAVTPAGPAFRILVPQVLSFDQLAVAYVQACPPADAMVDGQTSFATMVERAGGRDAAIPIGRALEEFVKTTPACRLVIDLPAPDPAQASNRHEALRAVNAYLLQTCDELIAVLDPTHYGVPGPFDAQTWGQIPDARLPADGTGALVKAWLRRPSRGPLNARAPLLPDGLHVIDPTDDERRG